MGKAQEFETMIDGARLERVKAYDMTGARFASIAKSVDADPNSKTVDEIVTALSAHHEFEEVGLGNNFLYARIMG